MTVLLFCGVAFAQFGPNDAKPYAWSPGAKVSGQVVGKWENSQINDPGYAEGDTAALAIELISSSNQTGTFDVCLQVVDSANYGFFKFN